MKTFKKISIITGILMVLFMSCDPIEDRDVLENSFNPDQIDLQVTHSSPGSNLFTLKMNTPGITGYWDYTINKGHGDEVQVLYPITGTQTFTYVVSSGYIPGGDINKVEYITKSIDVDITVLDKEVPKEYGYLVGDGSKTWVFDKSNPSAWWYMSDNNGNSNWWQPGFDPADGSGRMTFDLDGNPNFTYYKSADAAAVTGSKWVFNSDFTTITIMGDADILGVEGDAFQVGGLKEYTIMEMTDDRMVLFINANPGNNGWIWVFKPLGK